MLKKIVTLLLLVTLIGTSVFVSAQNGDENDPLVAKSYLDTAVIPYLESLVSKTKTSLTFSVVNLGASQSISGGAGCEMVLRMGNAVVFSSQKGGIADVTLGGDWGDGSAVPANHHLIVPMGDGRGITAVSDCIVLIKGEYTLK